ncbi:hypothetical protein PPYR_01871 [Photinus pyralis]|uniref:Uncharacterized protein n=1 Tax=Photinus pyralis TaxID=7054 RepID=A0A5N4AES4_PHOPY|nr:hypothetical protein PPYR_09870 [Photinus pyralis]KAB0804901.1 hypothetical protein PPYR_01871 [Photinus pyralis]
MNPKEAVFRYTLMELLEDEDSTASSDSEDSIEENVLQACMSSCIKGSRNCIKLFFENTVPTYSFEEFKMHFRITRPLFNSLAIKFRDSSEYKSIERHYNTVSYEKQVGLFLWFAGHEACAYRDLADRFDLSLWTVHTIIYRVSRFLSNMSVNVIKWPSLQQRLESEQKFSSKYNFPGVIGSIDGTHVIIDPPNDNKDNYIDRKGNVSICVQGICNERKKIIDIFIGFPGSTHDSRVLKNSPIFSELPTLIEQGHYLLGDSAYPCLPYLIVPYRDNGHLTQSQKYFNKRLSQIRVQIEHTFGLLKQRFRQLYYCKLKNIEILCHFIRACCVLHNLADQTDLDCFEEAKLEENIQTVYEGREESGKLLRDEICNKIFRNKN